MNQILLTENNNNKQKNINKNINKNNSNDIKKIIVFFSVVILVFGVAIGGVYGYRLLKNNKEEEQKISGPKISLPELEGEEEVEAEKITIISESKVGMSKIIYTWNDDEPIEIDMNGSRSNEEQIEVPIGKNTFKIKVIDENGNSVEKTGTVINKEQIIEDSDKIKINTSVVEEEAIKKVKIVATSEVPIEYMTYKWNEEEEEKIKAEDGEFTIETSIDVKRGNNKLTIIAKDTEGNMNTINKNFDGRLKPEITVYKEENKLYMKVSHDMGFKSIEFYVNGRTAIYDENYEDYDPEKEEIEYYLNLKQGENIVIIKAISAEETEEIYKGKCNYTAE